VTPGLLLNSNWGDADFSPLFKALFLICRGAVASDVPLPRSLL